MSQFEKVLQAYRNNEYQSVLDFACDCYNAGVDDGYEKSGDAQNVYSWEFDDEWRLK